MLVNIGVLALLLKPLTEAFSSTIVSSHKCRTHKQPWLKSSCYARPDPRAQFDLDAIEALEAQLDNLDLEDGSDDYDDFDEDVEGDLISTVEVKEYDIPEELDNTRIDAAIAILEPELSRSYCGNLVTSGLVKIVKKNGKEEVIDRKSFKVDSGAILKVTLPVEKQVSDIVAQDLPLEILYEDEHMIAINKAAGMVVHPAAGNWEGTVVNALALLFIVTEPLRCW